MARQPPWSLQIELARTYAQQATALRAAKNEVVGHALKKEAVVTSGTLDGIVRLASNKASSRPDERFVKSIAPRALEQEEAVRLQALQILASVAQGGTPFLAPLQFATALPAILSNLCPSINPAPLVLTALRALSNICASSALTSSGATQALSLNTLSEGLFGRQSIGALSRILSQCASSTTVQSQIFIAASLIGKLCVEERHQQALSDSGVLDALATRLASFVVCKCLVIPGTEAVAHREELFDYIPPPAPVTGNLSAILEAIAVIIKDSKYRASQLLYSPSILAVFPPIPASDFVPSTNYRQAWNTFNAPGLSSRQDQINAIDLLLPHIPMYQMKASTIQSSAFPPLGSSASRDQLAANGRSRPPKQNEASLPSWIDPASLQEKVIAPQDPETNAEEPESPLIAFLFLFIRSGAHLDGLNAAFVLAILYSTGLTNQRRESLMGLVVVPHLVRMLDEGFIVSCGSKFSTAEVVAMDRTIKEKTPEVLSILIKDNEYLHKAAFDAGLASKLSKMLKVAYNPVLETLQLSWSPVDHDFASKETSQSSKLGAYGQPPLLAHKIKVRESTLKAISALVVFKDEYRKAIVDQGIIPYIIESMRHDPEKPKSRTGEKNEKVEGKPNNRGEGYGNNPVSVLIAACDAIRALSRSVSILRTTLIDNGVASPVFSLLQHPDINVQISASAAVCNLVTDVSPMRESVTNAGVIRILCEQARSINAKLRINALWALKHFVCGVSNDMKRQCLEQLGQGWLVQLIYDDAEDELVLCKAGLNPTPLYSDEDVEMDQFEDSVETMPIPSPTRSNTSRPVSSRSRCIQEAEARLAALRDAEHNHARQAREDHLAVQEQALEFIRNLITGASSTGTTETTDMIDFLFTALGQDRVFEILASKLRPKIINPFRSNSSIAERRIITPQAEIIVAATFILVHMAASVPRHRQLVIAQTELLKLLVPQFFHPNVEVRTALCYLVTNLTWIDGAPDLSACAQRASELKKLGFLAKIEMLEDTDPELNVRQRAKCAIWQMNQPIEERLEMK